VGDAFVEQGGEHSKKIKAVYQTRFLALCRFLLRFYLITLFKNKLYLLLPWNIGVDNYKKKKDFCASAFLGLFQICKYYKPSTPFKDPNILFYILDMKFHLKF
jgi:hypothetical protein